jgi:hypothetical protein
MDSNDTDEGDDSPEDDTNVVGEDMITESFRSEEDKVVVTGLHFVIDRVMTGIMEDL